MMYGLFQNRAVPLGKLLDRLYKDPNWKETNESRSKTIQLISVCIADNEAVCRKQMQQTGQDD